ncbi:hypothetical protein KY358_01440 [Candidatus Woesearchaeota archaeon]|nr:hypothetical protein [Candidatus Woesearchaeota archaeon]
MKKGQGLSLNTIIIAAIVLIVLVVLWAVFTGRMGVFSKGVSDVTKGGTCAEANGLVKSEIEGCSSICLRVYGQFSDVTAGEICCKPTKAEACTETYGDDGKDCGVFSNDRTACESPEHAGCIWTTIDKNDC